MHTKDPFCIHPSIRPIFTILCTLDGAANVAPHGKYWARPVLEADSTRLFGKVETSIGRSTRLRRRSAATLRHRVADLPRRWGGRWRAGDAGAGGARVLSIFGGRVCGLHPARNAVESYCCARCADEEPRLEAGPAAGVCQALLTRR